MHSIAFPYIFIGLPNIFPGVIQFLHPKQRASEAQQFLDDTEVLKGHATAAAEAQRRTTKRDLANRWKRPLVEDLQSQWRF